MDIAQRFSTLVSLDQKTKPYHPDSDQSRWSIDQYGNDFWLRFTGDNELVISCRYEQQIPILKAMAEYAAVRLHLKIIPS